MSRPTFADVLDHSISSRGLTLDRVVHHLRTQGVTCSASTLSLWRRGRIRPSVQRSRRVLEALEAILKLRSGELIEVLGQPQPGDPTWWDQATPIHEWDSVHQAFAAFRKATGITAVDDLERLFTHMTLHIGADRTMERVDFSQVLRARRDDVDRMGAFFWTDYLTTDGLPVVFQLTTLAGASVARTAEFTGMGATAAMLMLDEPLEAGEVTVVDTRLERLTDSRVPVGWDFDEMQAPWPVRSMTLECRFAGDPPARVRARSSATLADGQALVDLPAQEMPADGGAQVTQEYVAGGGVRLEWLWEDEV